MTTYRKTQHDRMHERIEAHGRQLLALFPDARERDPQQLCKKLRRLETRAHRLAEFECGGSPWAIPDPAREEANIERALYRLLGSTRPWLNTDPRGYALKIDLAPGEHLHTDWGGYGILAPDLRED